MRRSMLLAGALALSACSSALPPAGPGFPDEVRSIRLYDGAGVDRTNHVFLFLDDTLHLEVRLFADDGRYLLEVRGGVEMSMDFAPSSIATSFEMPGETLKRAVTSSAARGTAGSLMVTLRFTAEGTEKSFGPFDCAVH